MNVSNKRIDALYGALVADAATMGLHWLYDQDHIAIIEQSGDILFRQPDANNYEGVKSYFAHSVKKLGDYSQYGESVLLIAKVIKRSGKYDIRTHQQLFFNTFGPCGSYHGFADRPTKALIARMIKDPDNLPLASGSDDDQLPALCSVPALFANKSTEEAITNAVSVTSIHKDAVNGAQVLNECLNRLQSGESLVEALTHSASGANTTLSKLLHEAMNQPQYRPLETAQQFGLACHMLQGLPLAWHLLQHAESFESVVRDNIRCGGDNCGRSMAIGSIAGLAFGVPEKLKIKVDRL